MSTAHTIQRYFVGVALALGFATAAPAQNDKQEVKVLHVLLVMDTSDPALDRGVRKDQRNITKLLDDNIPKNRYDLKVLSGPTITSDQVFSYYKNLKVDAGDGLLFYYSGHGAIVEGKGHTLELQSAKQAIRRTDLLKAMKAKNAALTMVLTDCCSNRISYADERIAAEGKGRDGLPLVEPTPLIRKLMFQTRGVVDITAATNDVALADDYQGGYFTKALCRITDIKKDNAMGWKDFFTAVSNDIGVIQKDAAARGVLQLAAGEKLKIQIPTAFSLAAETVSTTTSTTTTTNTPSTNTTPGARVAAIIGLANPATEEIEIQYRWDATHAWTKKKIPAGGKVSIGTVIPATMTKTPPLLVRVNGQDQTLETTRFEQARAPRLSDANVYKLGDKKDTTRGTSRAFELDTKPADETTTPAPTTQEGTALPAPPVGSPVLEK